MKKLALAFILALSLTILFAFNVFALDMPITSDDISSASATSSTLGKPEELFDGTITAAGGWYNSVSNGWTGPAGAVATIIFKEEFTITSASLYVWTNNCNGATFVFFDASGAQTGSVYKGAISVSNGVAVDLELTGFRVKSMTITMSNGVKYDGMGFAMSELSITALHEHRFDTYKETSLEATCGKAGTDIYSCKCGETTEVEVPATNNHSWDDGVETIPPTAETAGELTLTCTVCGTTKTEVIPAVGHNWDEGTVIAPTCDKKGYTIYECKDDGCEATYTAFETASLGHAYDDGVPLKHATLTSEGTTIFSCTRKGCDEQYVTLIPQANISDNKLTLGLDNIVSFVENIVGDASNNRDYKKLFDGNTANSTDSLYTGGGWWAPPGSSITIVFDEEYYILSAEFYLWSNWKGGSVEFLDANGNVVANVTHNGIHSGFQVQDGSAVAVSACVGKLVKAVRLTNLTAGGDGHALDFQEIVLVAHQHMSDEEYARYDEIAATCGETGSYKKFCYICEKEVLVETPVQGEHDLSEVIVYENGYTDFGTRIICCSGCSSADSTTSVDPLFIDLGYSIKTFGSLGIAQNVLVNRKAIAMYESVSGTTISFGVVAGQYTENPILPDGKASTPYLFAKDMTDYGYFQIFCKITGLKDMNLDDQFTLCAYICEGEAVSYIANGKTSDTCTPVTYNEILEKISASVA